MKSRIRLSEYNQGVLFAIAGIFLFSAKAVLVKIAYLNFSIEPVSLLLLRMIFALPVYLCILFIQMKKSRDFNVKKSDYMGMIFMGIIGYYLASYFDFEGLKYITASLERLILFVYPTLVLILSAIVFKTKIIKNQWVAILTTYLGVFITFFPSLGSDHQNNFWFGSILIFLSAVTYATYIVGSGRLIPKFGSVHFTAWAMTVSCIGVIIHHTFIHGLVWNTYPVEVYAIGFLMAIFSTVIPSFLVSEAIKKIGSSSFAIYGSLGPISTILLAVIFIGEVIDVYQFIGTVIVIVGVMTLKTKNFPFARLRNSNRKN